MHLQQTLKMLISTSTKSKSKIVIFQSFYWNSIGIKSLNTSLDELEI